MTFDEVRKKFPEYGDMSDADLAKGLHQKFYADMPFEEFSTKVGYAPKSKPAYNDLVKEVQSGPMDILRPARFVTATAETLGGLVSGIGSWALGIVGKQVGTGVATIKGDPRPSEFGKYYQEQIQGTLTYQPSDPVAIDVIKKVGYLMWPFQKAGEGAKAIQKKLGASPEVAELTGDIVEIGTMGLAGGIGAKVRGITKSRAEAFDLAKTMEKSMEDIVDPVQRKSFVDTVIKKSRETGRDPWDVLEETQQSMLPAVRKGEAVVKMERPWAVTEDGTVITDKGAPTPTGMTAKEIGIAKARATKALEFESKGESYVKGVEAELPEVATKPKTVGEVLREQRQSQGEFSAEEAGVPRSKVTYREGTVPEDIGGGQITKSGMSGKEARTIQDIFKDINTAIGERGSVGSGKLNRQQKEAVARLTEDMAGLKAKAREAGLSVKQYLINEGYPVEIAEAISRHSNVASITTPQTWQSVETYMNESREKQKELDRTTAKKVKESVVRLFVDRQGNMKREFSKAGRLGQDVVDAYELINGGKGQGNTRFHEAYSSIMADMSHSQRTMFDALVFAKRQLEISRYKPEHHLNGLGGEAWADYIGKLREQMGEKKFLEMEKKADMFFDSMREGTIDRLLDKGLIGETEYNLLNQYIYEPTKFIESIDPALDVMVSGKKGSVMSSGLQELGKGERALVETRADVLMQEAFNRTESRIANNEAARSAYDMAMDNPENGLVSVEKAKVKDPVLVGTMINGERYTYFMDGSIAKEWFNNDPLVNRHVVQWAQILSGGWLVRAMATGYNPTFFLRNLPRDIGLIWTSAEGTQAGYSSFLPLYLAQTGMNMSGVLMDVVRNKGIAKEFVEQGGSFEFLSTGQGRGMGEAGKGMVTSVRTVADALGWLGEKSEMLTRVALYKQGIKNGLTKKQAASRARRYLDFSQGGSLVKTVDMMGAPYLNASVQGTRSIMRGARENPALFTWKASQLMAVSSILYLYNHYSNGDTFGRVSDRDKVNNFIITTPYQFRDDKGQTRDVYFKIAKDQGQQIFSSMAEALMDKYYTGNFPSEQIMESWGQFLAVSPAKVVPPTIQATLGYMTNTDFWRGEPIYKGHQKVHPRAEIDNMVNPTFRWVGKIGLSPKRTEYAVGKILPNNNPLFSLFTGTVNAISGDLSKEVKQKAWEQLLLDHPAVRYVAGTTDAYNADRKAVDKIRMDDNTRVALANYEFDNLSDAFIRDPSDENKAELVKYLTNQPEKDQDRLANRFIKTKELFDIPERRWWINTAGMNPEARAAVFYGKYMSLNEKQRQEFAEQAIRVKGYITDRFTDKLVDLMQSKEQSGGENK